MLKIVAMSKCVKIVFAAVSVLVLAVGFFVPAPGQVKPSMRLASANNDAKFLWEEISSFSEIHGRNPDNVKELMESSESSRLVGHCFDPNFRHSVSGVTFKDSSVETRGRIIFAAEPPIRDPSTKSEVRIVVRSLGPPFHIPENEYQLYLKDSVELIEQ